MGNVLLGVDMQTRIQEAGEVGAVRGWVLFDGDCRFCISLVRRFGSLLRRHHYEVAPLQSPWVRDELKLGEEELLSEMRLLYPTGELKGGAAALLDIARQIWWAWPLYLLSRVPGMKTAMDRSYRAFARRRNCRNGLCRLSQGR